MKTGLKVASAAALALGLASLAFASDPGTAGAQSTVPAGPAATATQMSGQSVAAAAAAPAQLTKSQIVDVQKALAVKGCKVKADGQWGKWSKKELLAFQKKSGLAATGYPDAKTRQALGLNW